MRICLAPSTSSTHAFTSPEGSRYNKTSLTPANRVEVRAAEAADLFFHHKGSGAIAPSL
jgi:hypothetical protein